MTKLTRITTGLQKTDFESAADFFANDRINPGDLTDGTLVKAKAEGIAWKVDQGNASPDVTVNGVNYTVAKNYSELPKAFGAIGDGVADDTVAVQKAVDFVARQGLFNKLLKGGGSTYMISAQITLGNQSGPFAVLFHDLRLTAAEDGSFSAGDFMMVSNSNNVVFQVCRFFCNGVASGLRINAATLGLKILNSYFVKPAARGLWGSSGGGHDAEIAGNYFVNSDRSNMTAIGFEWQSPDVIFSNNTMQYMTTGAVFNFGGVQCIGNHIYQGVANPSTETFTAGFIFRDGDFVFNSNYVDQCKVKLNLDDRDIDTAVITDNLFFSNLSHANTDGFIEIEVDGASRALRNLTIKDNLFKDANLGAPNVRMLSKAQLNGGAISASKVKVYDNQCEGIIPVETRASGLFAIPNGSSNVVATVPAVSFPWGTFTFCLANIVNNGDNAILKTTPSNYGSGAFTFTQIDGPLAGRLPGENEIVATADRQVAAEVRNSVEFA